MTLEDFHYYENHYFAFNRRLLQFIGLWPYEKASQRALRVRFMNVIFFLSISAQVYLLLVPEISITRTIELLPTILPTTCLASVYNNIYYSFDTHKNLFDRIKSDWIQLTNQRNRKIMQKYARENQLYTQTITVLFCFYTAFLILPSISSALLNITGIRKDAELTLPLPMNFVLNNKLYYYLIFCMQFVCVYIVGTIAIAHYGMYITFLQHTYALCGIVAIQLDQPFKKCSSKSWHEKSHNEHLDEYYWVIGLILCYDKVISFVDLINGVYSRTFLVEVTTGLLFVIADYFYFFELVDVSANVSEILKCCLYTTVSLFMIYAICKLGQKLVDYNVDIFIKCCQIPFYEYSLKTQKALLLLIMRIMRPFGVSMRGWIISSHELFANIVRTSFSFATVFYNIR